MKQTSNWYRLDNAATMVPSTTKGADTRVFRIVCELKEEIDPEILQYALDRSVREYPHLNVALRKGLFWYYLDPIRDTVRVEEDHLPVCSALYFEGRKTLLYRVSYYGKRINLEMFHALADGTGGFVFMKTIVRNYLCKKHDIVCDIPLDERSSALEKTDDAFRHFYEKEGERKRSQLDEMTATKAYQLRGETDKNLQLHALEAVVSAGDFIAAAHKYNTTAGILATALFIQAILEVMSVADYSRPVVISVPVNLRQYFPSDTTRNFFGVITITYEAKDYDGTVESILPRVSEEFASQLSEEKLRATMNSYAALEQNVIVKLAPVFLKDIVIGRYNKSAKKGITATMSNLGRMKVEKELEPYIDHFTGLMSSPNMQVCCVSFGDKMVFGAVSAFTQHTIMRTFLRAMKTMGISAEVTTNDFNAPEPAGENAAANSEETEAQDAVLSEM